MDIFVKILLFVGIASLIAVGYVAMANWTRRFSRPNWLGLSSFIVGLVAYIGHKNSTVWGWTVLIGLVALAGVIRNSLTNTPQPAPQPQPQPAVSREHLRMDAADAAYRRAIMQGDSKKVARMKWQAVYDNWTPPAPTCPYPKQIWGFRRIAGIIPLVFAWYVFDTSSGKLYYRSLIPPSKNNERLSEWRNMDLDWEILLQADIRYLSSAPHPQSTQLPGGWCVFYGVPRRVYKAVDWWWSNKK